MPAEAASSFFSPLCVGEQNVSPWTTHRESVVERLPGSRWNAQRTHLLLSFFLVAAVTL